MQSTQAQMRRRERKRLKREEKRCQAADRVATLTRRDLSDSFYQFVRPLLMLAAPDVGSNVLKLPLAIALGVWNAVIATEGDVGLAAAFVEGTVSELRRKAVSATTREMIVALAFDKATLFADDRRIIGGLEVSREGADVRVVARAAPAADA